MSPLRLGWLVFVAFLFGGLDTRFAYAQVPCMPIEPAVGEITGPRYSEAEVFHAPLPDDQGILRVFANAKTGTWTEMVVNREKGVACIILAGKDFKPGPLDTPKPGKPL